MSENLRTCLKCGNFAQLMCARCFDPYCSAACQVNDWVAHRMTCRSMPGLVVANAVFGSKSPHDQNKLKSVSVMPKFISEREIAGEPTRDGMKAHKSPATRSIESFDGKSLPPLPSTRSTSPESNGLVSKTANLSLGCNESVSFKSDAPINRNQRYNEIQSQRISESRPLKSFNEQTQRKGADTTSVLKSGPTSDTRSPQSELSINRNQRYKEAQSECISESRFVKSLYEEPQRKVVDTMYASKPRFPQGNENYRNAKNIETSPRVLHDPDFPLNQEENNNNNLSTKRENVTEISKSMMTSRGEHPKNVRETVPNQSLNHQIYLIDDHIKFIPINEGSNIKLVVTDISCIQNLVVAAMDCEKTLSLQFNNLLSKLENYCQNAAKTKKGYCPQYNEVCLAIFDEDGNWYRAFSVSDKPENGKVKVFFIDYGNSSRVSTDNIMPIPEDLLFPTCANYCRIKNVEKKDVPKLKEYLDENPFITCTVKRIADSDQYDINIQNLNTILK